MTFAWSLSSKPQYCKVPRQGGEGGGTGHIIQIFSSYVIYRRTAFGVKDRKYVRCGGRASRPPAPPPCRTPTDRPRRLPPRQSSPVGPGTRVVPPRAWPLFELDNPLWRGAGAPAAGTGSCDPRLTTSADSARRAKYLPSSSSLLSSSSSSSTPPPPNPPPSPSPPSIGMTPNFSFPLCRTRRESVAETDTDLRRRCGAGDDDNATL